MAALPLNCLHPTMELAMMSTEGWISQTFGSAGLSMTGSDILEILFISLFTSLAVSILIVITERWHGRFSFDKDLNGIQKVHTNPVPRTGGIAMATGIFSASLLVLLTQKPESAGGDAYGIFKLMLASTPALFAGLVEDMTKSVSVKTRLLATFCSALLAAWLLGANLPRLDLWGVDSMLGFLPLSLAVTAFAVAGVTNSINIVDGFNGVAGGAIVVILSGMALLAWHVGDMFIFQLALAGIGAALGFLLLNYPTGRLFMGDGGAYLLGFWAAEVAVLMIVRNPGVTAWQILAIYAYPVIEVVFSMYRRKVVRKAEVGAPDRLHMHSLFYRRMACQKIPRNSTYPWVRNAAVACFVSTWIATATFLALSFGETTAGAIALVLMQALAYMAFYTRLIRGHWGRCLNPAVIFGWRPEPKSRPV
jgi:UDP-N-acetylmuramyl pentapeptide phosphotransferase/UDP-N-acetylglucosamine-1-phosphate transferase